MKRAGADLIITYHAKDAQDGYKKEALNNEKFDKSIARLKRRKT